MNPQLHRLLKIAQKPTRLIIGLMSGTSLDGLDVALCKIEGNGKSTRVHVLQHQTHPYAEPFKNKIKSVFAKKTIDFRDLCGLNVTIANEHADLLLESLKDWNVHSTEIDIIASHGQTVFHAPSASYLDEKWPNCTLQLGDGDHLAFRTGIITVSDFRQKHIAAGGEGAPLAIYGDYLLFNTESEHRTLLNLGGIANLTILPAQGERAFATDTGPANTLLNQYVQKHLGLPMDDQGSIAKTGKTHKRLLHELLKDPFFELPFPKTTGPEYFNLTYLKKAQIGSQTEDLSHPDVLATLCTFTAHSIAMALKSLSITETTVYFSGGGIHNPSLMEQLHLELPLFKLLPLEALGYPSDAKEALLFALMANECISGKPTSFAQLKGAPDVSMGKISFPG